MKSVHLASAWHTAPGGIRAFYRALMAAAPAGDHLLRLVVPAAESRIEDVSTHVRIYHLRAPRALFSGSSRWLPPHCYLRRRSDIRRILCDERPDLIEICDKYTLQYLAGVNRRNWLFPDGYRPTLAGLSCERMGDEVPGHLPRLPFSDAVLALARSPAERQARVRASLETVGRFDWSIVSAGFLRPYGEIHEWHSGARLSPRTQPDFISTAGNWFGLEV